MAAKKEEKSPYVGHSVEEVQKTEIGNYYIQIGENVFESDSGKLVFNRDRANSLYMSIWQGLDDVRDNGDPEDKEEALHCLRNFRIIPLRFH